MKRIAVMVFSILFMLASSGVGDEGGPDGAGYRWRDSKLPGPQESFAWIEIMPAQGGSGIDTGLWQDDQYAAIPLGFNFRFYDIVYNQIVVGSNGFLTFSTAGADSYHNVGIPDPDPPSDLIALFWDDLNIEDNWDESEVRYQVQGAEGERVLIVEWYRIPHNYDSTSRYTLEAILYQGSFDIKFQYYYMVNGEADYADGRSATIGIENADGSIGLQYSFNQQSSI